MLDVTEQLRRYADVVTPTVEAVRPVDVGSVTTEQRAGRPRRPVWQPLAVAAAAVALVAGGFWWATTRTDSTPPAHTDPSSVPKVTTGSRAGIELLDPGPLAPRADTATAWTGEELVVWGGDIEAFNQGLPGPDRQFADGAAYNPKTRHWRKLADGPLPLDANTPHAVATNEGVLITRGTSAALWDPRTNTWRKVDDAPVAVDDLEYTGTEVISATANATLDLESGHWTALPAPPVTLDRKVAVWNGSELVVVGQLAFYTAGGVAYDPARETWRELQVPSTLNPAAVSADRDGDRVVFVDYEMGVHTFRRIGDTDDWQTLPSVPARFYEYSPTIAATPPTLIVATSTAIAVLMHDTWVPMPKEELGFWSAAPVGVPAGAASDRASLFAFGITEDGQNRLALVDPERLAASARTLQVGEMTLHLPDGVELNRSAYDGTNATTQSVIVNVATATGVCTVTSTYDSGVGGDAKPWSPNATGQVWTARATSSDPVMVACEDPATAKRLVDATSFPSWESCSPSEGCVSPRNG